ncbi:hypothetical protein H8356DRAFT_1640878 [Neocallimastix lanati (nom. inval.)]|nr:hypothetical protein H8356DRAFT_1640878 [Neocallimastix sp. JGI-2020a]
MQFVLFCYFFPQVPYLILFYNSIKKNYFYSKSYLIIITIIIITIIITFLFLILF